MTPPSLLEVRGLSLETRGGDSSTQTLVSDLDFEVGRGDAVGILGESGSGKSLTSLALLGLLPVGVARTRGKVLFDGQELTGLGEKELQPFRGGRIALVFQDPVGALNPVLRVGKQVEEVLVLHKPDLGARERAHRIEELFLELGLKDAQAMARRYPHELSGGQRQRVLLAMALAGDPDILIADEPTTALDPTVQARILRLVKGIQKSRQLALLWISHDLGVLAHMCDRLLVLDKGRMVEQGTVAQIFENPSHARTRELVQAFPRFSSLTDPAPPSESPSQPVLVLDKLEVRYPSSRTLFGAVKEWKTAVAGIDLMLQPGRTLALVGESGSGKTSVVRAILGLVPAKGSIRLQTPSGGVVDLLALSEKKLRPLRREMGFVFQDPKASLNPKMTVGWSVAEPLAIHASLSESDTRTEVVRLLDDVGLLPEHASRFPHQMSGGQLQRVAIARALALKPRVILLDEAVSSLDSVVQDRILTLLQELQSTHGVAYLFITHDLRAARRLAHEVAVLQDGTIVEHGPAGRVFSQPGHPHTRALLEAVVEVGFSS